MNISDFMDEDTMRTLLEGAATKILQGIQKVTRESNEFATVRWIWELIQNAKDIAKPEGVIIEIIEQENQIIFRHNGYPFNKKHIRRLLLQITSKGTHTKTEEETREITGQFGTGFMTTHILSRTVIIKGPIESEDKTLGLFESVLDRSGNDVPTIVESIMKSFTMLSDIQPLYDSNNSEQLKTSFIYAIDDTNRDFAKKGIDTLIKYGAATLLFNPKINKFVIHLINNDKYIIQRNEKNNIQIIFNQSEPLIDNFIIKESDRVTVALPIKNNYLDKHFPRLFCDFPLIGSHIIPFPFIVQSSFFSPNEPRTGAYITNPAKTDIGVEKNKEYIIESLRLFIEAARQYCEDTNNIFRYNLVPNQRTVPESWIDQKWLDTTIFNPLYEKLKYLPLVRTPQNNFKSITDNIYFPDAITKEISIIHQFLMDLYPESVTHPDDIIDWKDRSKIWKDCINIDYFKLLAMVSRFNTLAILQQKLNKNNEETIIWLNNLIDFGKEKPELIKYLKENNLLPNQYGVFKKSTELYIDDNIPEPIKDVFLKAEENYRNILLHKDFNPNNNDYVKNVINITEIERKIDKIFTDTKYSQYTKAVAIALLACFPEQEKDRPSRQQVYNLFITVFPDFATENIQYINQYTDTLWNRADRVIAELIITYIQDLKTTEKVSQALNKDEIETVYFINDLIEWLENIPYNYKDKPLIPTLSGNLYPLKDLSVNVEINDELLQILEYLGDGWYHKLIHPKINTEIEKKLTIQDACKRISDLSKEKYDSHSTDISFYNAIITLENYFNSKKHTEDELLDLFGWLYRHYKDVLILVYKSGLIKLDSDTLRELNENPNLIKDLKNENAELKKKNEELEARIAALENQDKLKRKIEELEEAMAILLSNQNAGITIEEEEEEEDLKIKYAEMARENVKNYLESLGYDVTKWQNDYQCIYGVTYQGIEIPIVVKSARRGKIRLLNMELQHLRKPNARLFVINNLNQIHNCTFADLLRIGTDYTINFNNYGYGSFINELRVLIESQLKNAVVQLPVNIIETSSQDLIESINPHNTNFI